MAFRTDAERVRKIVEVDDGVDLIPFIETANSVVTDICVNTPTYTYTAAKLEVIERWLAGHFYMVFAGGMITVEQAASLREQYAFKVDVFLKNTHWGQQAIALDTAGNLARWQMKMQKATPTPGVFWLGKGQMTPYSEE